MPFCNRCRNEVKKRATVCNRCGFLLTEQRLKPRPQIAINQQAVVKSATMQAPPPPPSVVATKPIAADSSASQKSQGISGLHLAWSIVNIVLSVLNPLTTAFCLPLAIIALVFVCTAPNSIDEADYNKKIRLSMILNVISLGLLIAVTALIFGGAVAAGVLYFMGNMI